MLEIDVKLGCAILALALFASARASAEPTARFGDAPRALPESPGVKPSPRPERRTKKEPWVRASAREEVRRAVEHARRGDVALALSEYNDAIHFDPSFGEAYLGLGSLREAMRDYAEAERVYDLASKLLDVRARSLAARARVRRALGRDEEAFRDLEASVEIDPEPSELKALGEWYVARRAWPAALVAWRRLYSLLENENSVDREEARLKVQALSLLAADSDPVLSGGTRDAGWVRRSLASMAKRK